MNAEALIADFERRGIRLIPDPPKLAVEPASRLTDADCAAIRAHKAELLALLSGPATERARQPITPDSRHPLIADAIRAKIEAIETEARRLGWPAELLWNAGFWDRPRGLAAVLDAHDEITDVRPDYIEILRTKRDLLRFCRHAA